MEEVLYFYNKPSIIDLYIDETGINNKILIERLYQAKTIGTIISLENKQQIIKLTTRYENNSYHLYLQIRTRNDVDLRAMSNVLVNEERLSQAEKQKFYLKTSLETKRDFIKGYYYQLKVLAALSAKPLLLNDNSQACLYSAGYLKQLANSQAWLVDTHLFKIRFDSQLCLYTEGLDRFGIKEVVMILDSAYGEEQAALLSRLARFYIENGQVSNSITHYPEVLENNDLGCLLEFASLTAEYGSQEVSKVVNDLLINEDYLLFSLHEKIENDDYLLSERASLVKLKSKNIIYMSRPYFEQLKIIAQENIIKVVQLLLKMEAAHNLMILTLDENLNTGWYYFDDYVNDKIIIKSHDNVLAITARDVLNFNYKGITPLYSYCLFE